MCAYVLCACALACVTWGCYLRWCVCFFFCVSSCCVCCFLHKSVAVTVFAFVCVRVWNCVIVHL